ncbi:MAG: peptidoglycan-associated lipoprotein [Gallionellales bacterium GWA2_60_18]|nr:MAG: peptidoglycan-associated lipoprotein [Gallionellales bacterium GWA2_60_18]
MKKLVISIVLINLLAACASNKPADTSTASGSTAASDSSASAGYTGKTDMNAFNDPNGLLAKRSVYYPFDVSAVQDADKPAVQAHAAYLRDNPNRNARLEGNCDERGSNEYNLALGQRRADGVKKMLELGGAKAGQLESVSYGEEKPRASGHEEASWAQNRRTDLNYAN